MFSNFSNLYFVNIRENINQQTKAANTVGYKFIICQYVHYKYGHIYMYMYYRKEKIAYNTWRTYSYMIIMGGIHYSKYGIINKTSSTTYTID